MSANVSLYGPYRARDEKRLNSRNKPETWSQNQIAELVVDEGVLRIFQGIDGQTVRRVFWLCDESSGLILDVLISMLPIELAQHDFPTGYQVWGEEVVYSPRTSCGYLVETIAENTTVIDAYPAMVMPLPSFARS